MPKKNPMLKIVEDEKGEKFNFLALECEEKDCDGCPFRFKCFTNEDADHISCTKEEAFKNLEYSKSGVYLVWKTSKTADKGKLTKVFA